MYLGKDPGALSSLVSKTIETAMGKRIPKITRPAGPRTHSSNSKYQQGLVMSRPSSTGKVPNTGMLFFFSTHLPTVLECLLPQQQQLRSPRSKDSPVPSSHPGRTLCDRGLLLCGRALFYVDGLCMPGYVCHDSNNSARGQFHSGLAAPACYGIVLHGPRRSTCILPPHSILQLLTEPGSATLAFQTISGAG